MYGLVISKFGESDLVKIASHKEKLYAIAEQEIVSYIKKRKLKKSGDISTLLNCLEIRDYESAMDLFGTITEKANEAIFMVLMEAEIIYDA